MWIECYETELDQTVTEQVCCYKNYYDLIPVYYLFLTSLPLLDIFL
uniref:Uncharacterized protein n=1 Tax=Lepeophtheirus salmonis TaxID=72036 RepID=A0A0K2V0P5_LEPSM